METIPVPALVSTELFDAVAEQLEENRRRQRERQTGGKYLLSGLLVCHHCGSAYCGRRNGQRPQRTLLWYRCIGTDKARCGGTVICQNGSLNGPLADEQVWSDVCGLLRDPDRLRREFDRRLERGTADDATLNSLRQSITALKRRLARLLDAWENGWIERSDFEPRIARVRERIQREEASLTTHERSLSQDATLRLVIADFSRFAEGICQRLDTADFEMKRNILRLLVKRIEVDTEEIRIVYKVNSHPFAQSPVERGNLLQDCSRRHNTAGG
jgi:site-specific DNA recombinase